MVSIKNRLVIQLFNAPFLFICQRYGNFGMQIVMAQSGPSNVIQNFNYKWAGSSHFWTELYKTEMSVYV